jgi:hypothetical protein
VVLFHRQGGPAFPSQSFKSHSLRPLYTRGRQNYEF